MSPLLLHENPDIFSYNGNEEARIYIDKMDYIYKDPITSYEQFLAFLPEEKLLPLVDIDNIRAYVAVLKLRPCCQGLPVLRHLLTQKVMNFDKSCLLQWSYVFAIVKYFSHNKAEVATIKQNIEELIASSDKYSFDVPLDGVEGDSLTYLTPIGVEEMRKAVMACLKYISSI